MTVLTLIRAISGANRLFAISLYIAFFFLLGTSLSAQSVIFSTPGTTTWTVPAGVNLISVEAWGAGGGGSKGFSSLKGTGGGGGGFASGSLAVHPGDIISVTVGAGGAGATVAGNGSNGGNSIVTFSSNTLIAFGGGGAKSDNVPSGTGGTGGNGSLAGAWTFTSSYCGGFGANLTAPTASTPGGGAGGGAGQNGNGKNAGNATSNCSTAGGGPSGGSATGSGGAGGAGGTINSNGVSGSTYGGGGGGNAGTGSGGDGANGYVTISYALALPVELKAFTATSQDCHIRLEWQTASELNFSHFEIERSTNGRDFTGLGLVHSTANGQGGAYHFLDETAFQQAYYRLKMVDIDGSSEYSKIVETSSKCGSFQIVIFPNPLVAGQQLKLNVSEENNHEFINLEIIASSGKSLQLAELKLGLNQLDIATLPPSTYWLKIMDETGKPHFQKLVIVN